MLSNNRQISLIQYIDQCPAETESGKYLSIIEFSVDLKSLMYIITSLVIIHKWTLIYHKADFIP